MPLHADDRETVEFDSFYIAIAGCPGGDDAFTEAVKRLVVEAVYVVSVAVDAVQDAALDEVDVMDLGGPGDVEAGMFGDVLVERASSGDVEHLNPTADTDGRKLRFDGELGQRQLELIALGLDRAKIWIWRRVVALRVDVRAAREHQTVYAADELVWTHGHRKVHRKASRGNHSVHVVDEDDIEANVLHDVWSFGVFGVRAGPARDADHRFHPRNRICFFRKHLGVTRP